MSLPILSASIPFEHDTVAARQRARQIARLLGFDHQEQTRISTAVSEIARNAFNYAGGGRVEYLLEGRTAPQLYIIKIAYSGPGIRDLDTILESVEKTGRLVIVDESSPRCNLATDISALSSPRRSATCGRRSRWSARRMCRCPSPGPWRTCTSRSRRTSSTR